MKKLFRPLLCAAFLALAVSAPAFAAEPDILQTFPDTVSTRQGDFYVLVNGESLTFPDAVPKLKSDRSFLPFAATFEALGYTGITWDGSTGTVTASRDGQRISLTIGEPSITLYTEEAPDGQNIPMDVAPYVDPATDRTYVPVGLIADALGYNVGWDGSNGTVIIDDVDAILAANTETYELMDKYLDYSRTFAQKNQKVGGEYAMDISVSTSDGEQDMDIQFLADGDYDMITAGSTAFQFDTQMVLDYAASLNGVDATELLDSTGELPFPLTIDFAMRGDMEQGALYLNCAALNQFILGEGASDDTWYKLDMKSFYDQSAALTGFTYADLLALSNASLDASFTEQLETVLRTAPLTSYLTTSDYLDLYNSICGDSHFKRSGSSYVNQFLAEDGVTGTFTLYTTGSRVNGYAMELTAVDPSFGEMEIGVSMRTSKMEMSIDLTQSSSLPTGEDPSISTLPGILSSEVSMHMEMDGAYQSTSAKPSTQPPADATVLDMFQLLSPDDQVEVPDGTAA